jgi:5-methylcytosine-specific restriction endonuclease McrA
MDYESYIKSSEWTAKRETRLKYDNYTCKGCGDTENLEVHHIYGGPPFYSYKKPLGEEELEDLITFCKWCHEGITDSVRRRRFEALQHPSLTSLENVIKQNITKEVDIPPELKSIYEKNLSNSGNKALIDAQQPAFRSIK